MKFRLHFNIIINKNAQTEFMKLRDILYTVIEIKYYHFLQNSQF